jgi:cytochrome c peroxidase
MTPVSSPSLINVKFTAPYGLSGEFADLQSFSANAVKQHFTRSLNRVVGTDFRVPAPEELDALAAFQNSLVSPADENFDETHQFDRFLTTASQIRGRDAFFGPSKCSACHGGKALSISDGRFGTTLGVNQSFNTGVVNLSTGLPTEQDAGQPPNSRKFNVPALFGVKNTGPFFHDGSASDLLSAIDFYNSAAFASSPAGAQVGGVLEPVGARPVVVEDDAFVGGGAGIYEGTRVGRRAVIAPGVVLTRAVPLHDLVRGTRIEPDASGALVVPEGAVVVPGSRAATDPYGRANGIALYAAVVVKYRDGRSDAATALEEALR